LKLCWKPKQIITARLAPVARGKVGRAVEFLIVFFRWDSLCVMSLRCHGAHSVGPSTCNIKPRQTKMQRAHRAWSHWSSVANIVGPAAPAHPACEDPYTLSHTHTANLCLKLIETNTLTTHAFSLTDESNPFPPFTQIFLNSVKNERLGKFLSRGTRIRV